MRKKTNKELTQELQLSSKDFSSKELLTPIVKPVTRQELVDRKAKELEAGEITAWDFAQELKLTEQQFKFAEIFSSVEYLGDGSHAAMIAFDIKPDELKATLRAKAIAKRLEKHQGVCTLINALLTSQGWNESNVRKQHLFLINQNVDLKMKGIAIKLWYDVNGMLKKEQEISIKHSFDYSALNTEELMTLKKAMDKAAGKITIAQDIEEVK